MSNQYYDQQYYGQQYGYGQQAYYQQPQETEKKKGFRQTYFGWLTPAMIIWFIIAFLCILAAIYSVGCGLCSVAQACGTWSFNSQY